MSIRQRRQDGRRSNNNTKTKNANHNNDTDEDKDYNKKDAILKKAVQRRRQRKKKGYNNIITRMSLFYFAIIICIVCAVLVTMLLYRRIRQRLLLKKDLHHTSTSTTSTTTTTTRRFLDYIIMGNYSTHDPTSFTQGLSAEYRMMNGNEEEEEDTTTTYPSLVVVESTGRYSQSILRMWDPWSGTIYSETKLDDEYFGEGMTPFTYNGQTFYIVLTYREGKALIHDSNLQLVVVIDIPSTVEQEAWGISFRDEPNEPRSDLQFYVTDGSQYLYTWNMTIVNGVDYRVAVSARLSFLLHEVDRKSVHVSYAASDGKLVREPAKNLNELEYDVYSHTILANIWFETVVVRIDPANGLITHVYDLSKLQLPMQQAARVDPNIVLNGIAIIPNSIEIKHVNEEGVVLTVQEWFVTGKFWPQIYHLKILIDSEKIV